MGYDNLRFDCGEESDVEGGLWGYVNYRFDVSSESDSEADLELCGELNGLLGGGSVDGSKFNFMSFKNMLKG